MMPELVQWWHCGMYHIHSDCMDLDRVKPFGLKDLFAWKLLFLLGTCCSWKWTRGQEAEALEVVSRA